MTKPWLSEKILTALFFSKAGSDARSPRAATASNVDSFLANATPSLFFLLVLISSDHAR